MSESKAMAMMKEFVDAVNDANDGDWCCATPNWDYVTHKTTITLVEHDGDTFRDPDDLQEYIDAQLRVLTAWRVLWASQQVPVYRVATGQSFRVGDDVYMRIAAPPTNPGYTAVVTLPGYVLKWPTTTPQPPHADPQEGNMSEENQHLLEHQSRCFRAVTPYITKLGTEYCWATVDGEGKHKGLREVARMLIELADANDAVRNPSRLPPGIDYTRIGTPPYGNGGLYHSYGPTGEPLVVWEGPDDMRDYAENLLTAADRWEEVRPTAHTVASLEPGTKVRLGSGANSKVYTLGYNDAPAYFLIDDKGRVMQVAPVTAVWVVPGVS